MLVIAHLLIAVNTHEITENRKYPGGNGRPEISYLYYKYESNSVLEIPFLV